MPALIVMALCYFQYAVLKLSFQLLSLEGKTVLPRNSPSISRNENCTADVNYVLLHCFKLNRIPKKTFLTQESFQLFSRSFYALQHRLLSYLVSDMYLNRRAKLLVSVMLSSYFFSVKCHYLVFARHGFSSFRGFYQK